MKKLNFYTVDLSYVDYLKDAECKRRGFTRVPNMAYGDKRKQKFLCGVVLQVGGKDYYVPVTSYTQQKPDNFLIRAANGQVTSSLRFNYMFPVPKELIAERTIANEPDRAYRALLTQELQYCIKNQETICRLAERTYKRVLLGKNPGLIQNSCDFKLLESACASYTQDHIRPAQRTSSDIPSQVPDNAKQSVLEKLQAAQSATMDAGNKVPEKGNHTQSR